MHALHKLLLLHVLICHGQTALGSKIINGDKAPQNLMQYMVSVQNNRGHVCGGFLVSDDFVVTAAHCNREEPTRVVLGTHNLKRVDHENIRSIAKTYKHPSFVSEGYGKDIMLLKLSAKAPQVNGVQTIPLPSSELHLGENEICRVAGWGGIRSKGAVVDDLRVADVSIIKPQVCKKEWPHLPANVICAGGYETNKGFCQGDSGGPLVCNGMAVGVVSFNKNFNCKYPDVPNVYTDISKHLTWINGILKGETITSENLA